MNMNIKNVYSLILVTLPIIAFAKDPSDSRNPANVQIEQIFRPRSTSGIETGAVVRVVDTEYGNVCYFVAGNSLTGTAISCVPIKK